MGSHTPWICGESWMTLLHSRTSRSRFNAVSLIIILSNIVSLESLMFIYMLMCRWGNIEFPLPFGRVLRPTENFIHKLDEKVAIFPDLHLLAIHVYIILLNLSGMKSNNIYTNTISWCTRWFPMFTLTLSLNLPSYKIILIMMN